MTSRHVTLEQSTEIYTMLREIVLSGMYSPELNLSHRRATQMLAGLLHPSGCGSRRGTSRS